jgi:UDP-glucose 4-epimerase
MARFLVTGGAGFIGSHLCSRLLGCGHRVRVLDDLSRGCAEAVPPAAELGVGDAAERDVAAAAAAGCDGIFHLAGIGSAELAAHDNLAAHRANQTTAIVALDVARAAGGVPVVLASSAAVYGAAPRGPIRETMRPRPVSAYGADKLAAELHAGVAWAQHRVPTAALRIFNAYGPSVIGAFAARIRAGVPPVVHGDGRQTRDFVAVEDVVRHLEAAMTSLAATPRAIVCNVCTGEAIGVLDLARRMAALAGRADLAADFAAARAADILESHGDPHHAIHEFGVRAEICLDDGLRRILAA